MLKNEKKIGKKSQLDKLTSLCIVLEFVEFSLFIYLIIIVFIGLIYILGLLFILNESKIIFIFEIKSIIILVKG